MTSLAPARPVTVPLDGSGTVSGLLIVPASARAAFVFAHGAGADMSHPFMTAAAIGLGERGIATLRYQFPSMERGSKRPDAPRIAQAAVRASVGRAIQLLPDVPLIAGGKSFGGRMTSQAQAEAPLPRVRGLVFLGFPLHPAGKPSTDRAAHLARIGLPMLFLQGSRDTLAETSLITDVATALGPRATLRMLDDADHSFHVPARSGRSDAQVLDDMLDTFKDWSDALLATGARPPS